MGKWIKIILITIASLATIALTVLFLQSHELAVMSPKGLIGVKERDLIVTATLWMLAIVIPVLILTFVITWKYRTSNKKAKYDPNWNHSTLAEVFWWGLPLIVIVVLSVMTWKSCYDLDPFKPLKTDRKPITIQVVALQWKWLFIYPEEKIATVNYLQFPEKTPIHFVITADAPMNSFWIPQLGGQIYAMAGMKTSLYLIADEAGSYRGLSSNISGRGFAGMTFTANACSDADFNQWVQSAKKTSSVLNFKDYQQLAQPTENAPKATYVLGDEGLFDQIVMNYMMPMDGDK